MGQWSVWADAQSPSVGTWNWYRCSWPHLPGAARRWCCGDVQRQESSSMFSFCIWTQPSRLCKRKSVQAGISHLFKVLITRCLTSAPISIHEPLIFVTKSSRLDHLRGEDANKGEHSNGTSAALASVSRFTRLLCAHLMMNQLHTHTVICIFVPCFRAKDRGQLCRCQ